VRIQAAGVWGNWMMAAGSAPNKKNYIVNGAMQISQENGTTALTGFTGKYPADQFWVVGSAGGAISFSQVNSLSPAGSPNRIRITATTADASVGATDNLAIYQPLEGLRTADLKFGTAAAKTVTIQFGVRAPAGTYSVVLKSGSSSRSYVAEYVITAGEANTDVIKSVTIPGSTTGTFLTDNNAGMEVRWGLMAGSNWRTTAGSWANFDAIGSTNQFNFMGTINNIFELFDVSMTEGSVAPPFVVPDYASEYLACQRYWRRNLPSTVTWLNPTTARTIITAALPFMRVTPAVTIFSGTGSLEHFGVAFYNVTALTLAAGGSGYGLQFVLTVNGGALGAMGMLFGDTLTLDARM
jgi:hypothetical protein